MSGTQHELAVAAGPEAPATTDLMAIAKTIGNLDDLVRALGNGLSRAKPWQRQLTSRLGEIDRNLQVLHMTVALERTDHEILSAAVNLSAECRSVGLAVAGSRADLAIKGAVRLIAEMAAQLLRQLQATQNEARTAKFGNASLEF